MLSNLGFVRGFVSRVIGISALIAILFVAGCSTNGSAQFAVTTTSASLPAGSISAGAVYPSTTLTASNGTAPYKWTASGSLDGLTLSTGGVLSGTPTASGTFPFTVTVTDSAVPAHTATASLSITINGAITVSTSGTLATVGGVGAAYSDTLAETGGVGPFTWTLVGTLPTGLSLGPTTGTISGTISGSAGSYTFSVKVTDSQGGASTSGTLTLTVDPAVTITAPAFPNGAVGVSYAAPAFSATGGSGSGYTYAVATGSIAPLTLNAGTGIISGTPTTAGPLSFTVKVTDSLGFTATSGALSITVNPAITVGLAPTSPVTLDQSGTQLITATVNYDPASAGVTWAIASGAGSLTGSTATTVTYNAPPSVSAASTATVKATSVTDPSKSATFSVNLVPPPAIAPATLPGGNVGTPYNQSVSVTNGIGPYTWSITGTQIAGVTFTPGATSAALSGIPTTATTYSFTVKVTDSGNPAQSSSVAYSVVIGAQLPLSITTSSLPGGALNSVYGPLPINATGGYAPYSFGATGLPAGLTLSSSGSLTGTPTAAGTGFSVAITVTDSETPTPATATVTLPLTITSTPLVLSPGSGSLPNATQNAPYTTSFTPSGGAGPYTITLDGASAALPSPLVFNATSGTTTAATITGTPTATGTTTGIIVDVTDSESPAVTQKFTYSLTVVVPCGSGSESLLSGQYAFVLRGFDGSGNVAVIGGVLTASGASGSSNLTAGVVDMNLSGGVQSNLAIASGSNYTVGSDGRGCMAITTSAGTQNYRFSLGASGNGHMIDFDTAGPFTSGVLRKQTASAFSTAQISGNYAFGVASPQDSAQGGGKAAGAGVLNLSAGSVTGGSMDYNDYNATMATDTLDGVSAATAWPASPIAINSGGSYSVSGTNGRGTVSFTPSGASAFNAYIYVVSSAEVLIIDSDARTVGNLFAGVAFKQSGGPYATSSLNGKSVIYTSKISQNGGTPDSVVQIGIVNTTGASATFTYAGYSNGGGTIQTPTNNSASGTFSVASNGRVTLTVSGGGGGNETPEFYLFSPGNAFTVFSGKGVDEGFMESQTTTSVTNGTYTNGTIDPQTAGVSDKVAIVTLTSGNGTSTDDSNSQGTLSPNNVGTGTYSVDSTGVFFLPASCVPGTSCEKIGTVINGSKIIVMDAKSSSAGGTTNPALQVLDQ